MKGMALVLLLSFQSVSIAAPDDGGAVVVNLALPDAGAPKIAGPIYVQTVNPTAETARVTIEGAIATLLTALIGFFAYSCMKKGQ